MRYVNSTSILLKRFPRKKMCGKEKYYCRTAFKAYIETEQLWPTFALTYLSCAVQQQQQQQQLPVEYHLYVEHHHA